MKVLFVTSEAHPLLKTGGLADVSEALPHALNTLGVDTRVLLPGYPSVTAMLDLHRLVPTTIRFGASFELGLLRGTMPNASTPVYVIECDALYAREGGGPYLGANGEDWPDNAYRFGALAYAAAVIGSSASPLTWHPDIVHCNDWQSGLAPAYLHHNAQQSARTLMSVHNIYFPGSFDAEWVERLMLPATAFNMEGVEFYGKLSFLKAGLYYADRISTVSPTYAEEIKTRQYGGGFDGLLRARSEHVIGILNGIDTTVWNPATDQHLTAPYDINHLTAKTRNTDALRERLGLARDSAGPLFGMVSRLTPQKGADLIPDAIAALDAGSCQIAILGSGDASIERMLRELAATRPLEVAFVAAYDEALAHQIEAGADAFVMPSRFEPCGLNQMYSMRYGTPPLVRRTGGLADTVTDASPATLADGSATGFVFDDPSAEGLSACMRRAIALFADERAWADLQRNAMRVDASWASSASAYETLYASMLERTH